MAHIGNDIFIGAEDWFIGGWTTPPVGTDAAFLGLRPEDLWVYRNANNEVITELSFGDLAPAGNASEQIKIQYRGWPPVLVTGFYLTHVPEAFYAGDYKNTLDKTTLIQWADRWGTGGGPGQIGLELQQTNVDNDLLEIDLFRSGTGDAEYSPLHYKGHVNGILRRDDMMEIELRLNPPDDATQRMLAAGTFHFGLEISFMEIPENLFEVLEPEEC